MTHHIRIILSIIIFSIFLSTAAFAAETRGLSVVSKDPVSGQQTEVKLYNKSYAVIIGIDQYQNLSMSEQLTYAVRDAKGVEDVLRKNFKFDKIITLYNKQATKDNILKVLMEDLPNEMTEEDSLFVFWAGHGNQETTRTGDLGYLIPYDGHIKKLQSNISMNLLKDDISKKLPAKHVFYVMDACYSGLLTATRALEKETKRDFNYLQEITREPVRQVLTAGSKNQKVLDGGPKGHSVFTGRMIEQLENAEDFITANELQAKVTEKVFSDARSMSATQTPGYGKLYGVGDFVFIPSLEKKAENTGDKVAALQKEMDRLNLLEADAAKADDDQARRKVEIEKRQVEARLRAEQLRRQTLDEQQKKRLQEQQDETRQQTELVKKKQEDDQRLAMLKKDVEEKRKGLGSAVGTSLSPQKTMDEMQIIDGKIRQMREQFRTELKNGILQIVNRINIRHLKLVDAKKDEFESAPEFNARIKKGKDTLNSEQTAEFTSFQNRLEDEYNRQLAPFIAELKKLSGREFTITAGNLTLELGTYNGATNTYPVTIKAKKPLEILIEQANKTAQKQAQKKYVMLAASAEIPIPRDEAREFKQHFTNNMLRPEIKGNFQTPEGFMIAQAYVIDDATTKQYDMFTAKFVDLGNGTVYDTGTKLMWTKDANYFGKPMNRVYATEYLKKTKIAGLLDWRIPTAVELFRMQSVYRNLEPHPFINIFEGGWLGTGVNYGYLAYPDKCVCLASPLHNKDVTYCFNNEGQYVWPVRGASQ